MTIKIKETGTVRGVYLDDADYADLKLFMATDRRSLSFLVRDAIALYLRSRQEELQRLKNSNLEGKVQPMNGTDRVTPEQKHIDAAKTLVSQSIRGRANVEGVQFILIDEAKLVDRISISLAGREDMAAGSARIDEHTQHCSMCQRDNHCDIGSSLRMDFRDAISRSGLAAQGKFE